MVLRTRSLLLTTVIAIVLAACTGDTAGPAAPVDTPASEGSLALAPANFDLAVGPDRRLILAVFTDQRERVAGGELTLRLAHLGDEPGGEAVLGEPVAATFLPIPGLDIPAPDTGPSVVGTDVLTGVYRASVDLDAAGYWGVWARAELTDGRVLEGRTILQVLDAPAIVTVGDRAPRTDHLIRADVEAGLAPPSSLDSRLQTLDDPDRAEVLHTTRLNDAIDAGRPVVLAITTPVYCVSLVCGPLTEYLVDVHARFGDRADFIHLEVWEDFEAQRLNPAAATWIQTATGGNEPWVFLIGPDGDIIARWDNVVDVAELESALSAFPVLGAA